MDLQNLKESFWRSIKFFLLFLTAMCIIYIVLTKFILKIPIVDNKELLSSMSEFEKIIDSKKNAAEESKRISNDIKTMEFDVYQVQRQEEIKLEVLNTQSIYLENNMNSKYKFSLQVKNVIEFYYNTREKNSKLKHNIELLNNNLTECQANI